MTLPQLTNASSLEMLRKVQLSLFPEIILAALLAEYFRKPEMGENYPLVLVTGFCGVAILGAYAYVRSRLPACDEALRLNPEDRSALGQRQKWYILLFALSQSIVFLGCVLRYMGTPLAYCVPFYAAGTALLLMSAPRKLD